MQTLQIGMRWSGGAGSGGLDRVFSQLVDGLPRVGIAAFGLVEGPTTVGEATGGRVRSIVPRPSHLVGRLRGARAAVLRSVASDGIDLVDSHFALYAAPALDVLRKRPLVTHFHGPWADESAQSAHSRAGIAFKRGIEKLVYRASDRVIVLSHAFADLVVRDYGVPSARVRIVPGGVDLAGVPAGIDRSTARRQFGWPEDRPILISVRRLEARMGLGDLLTAMVEVVRAVPDVLLVIGGLGSLAAALKAQVAAAGLDRHVTFLGFVPEADLPYAYAAADFNVVSTRALEGFGLVAIEAIAAGTPSIVTAVGGLPEIVQAFSPDLICPPADPEALAALLKAALDGRVAVPDAASCRRYAETFDSSLVIQRTADVYRELA